MAIFGNSTDSLAFRSCARNSGIINIVIRNILRVGACPFDGNSAVTAYCYEGAIVDAEFRQAISSNIAASDSSVLITMTACFVNAVPFFSYTWPYRLQLINR